MGIKYFQADDIKKEAEDIVNTLNWKHIDLSHMGFLRSTGSVAPRTIARCHTLGKAMQIAMGRPKGFYLIEVISEKFDRLSKEEQTKTIIHELMHIPKTFGGGFIHHDVVHERNVRIIFEQYFSIKRKNVFYMLNKKEETANDGIKEAELLVQEEKIYTPRPLKPNPAIKDTMFKMEKKFRWF